MPGERVLWSLRWHYSRDISPSLALTAVGIGLLLAFTGLVNLGIVVFDKSTLLTLGGCRVSTHRTYIYEFDHPIVEASDAAHERLGRRIAASRGWGVCEGCNGLAAGPTAAGSLMTSFQEAFEQNATPDLGGPAMSACLPRQETWAMLLCRCCLKSSRTST